MYVGVDMIVCSKECHSLGHLKRQRQESLYILKMRHPSRLLLTGLFLPETSYKQKKNGVGTKNVCIGQRFAGFVPKIGTRMRYRSLPARDLTRYSGDVAMLVLRVERYRGPRLAVTLNGLTGCCIRHCLLPPLKHVVHAKSWGFAFTQSFSYLVRSHESVVQGYVNAGLASRRRWPPRSCTVLELATQRRCSRSFPERSGSFWGPSCGLPNCLYRIVIDYSTRTVDREAGNLANMFSQDKMQ